MKITDIEMENLGPYVGKNALSFDVSDPSRNVVLIGGKNGAGKTTLFNAIKIGLYGCRAYGFESENAKYLEAVSQLINSDAKLERAGTAGIRITILMEDGKDDFHYRFERFWKLSTKQLREHLRVYRDDVPLDETEKSDVQSYLVQLIPPDMFRFYFFDGESIGGFRFNGVRNTDFRNAFLKLCGLDTMDIIHENLLRMSNTRKKDLSGTYESYEAANNEYERLQQALFQAEQRAAAAQDRLVSIDEALAQNENRYTLRGGITAEEYGAMHTQLSREEVRRDTARRWLRETANHELPFVILRDQLVRLRTQLVEEERQQTARAFRTAMNSPATHSKLFSLFSEVGIHDPIFLSEKVISTLSDSVEAGDGEPILNLSKREYLDLTAKISALLSFDTEKVKDAVQEIDDSLKESKRIREKLDRSDVSGADAFLSEREQLLADKQEQLQQLYEAEQKVGTLRAQCAQAKETWITARKKYEAFLKAQSVSDTTAKAILAFSELQRRLYQKYISDVERAFQESFRRLINKSDLIDGIIIDEQLQVFPYKNRVFSRAELRQAVQTMGPDYLVEQLGGIAYEAYLKCADGTSPELTLPVAVKQQLSAGEKQVFIMALYQALSSLNKVSVPYLIDTPFARIDNEHRQNILQNFFMKLNGQIIILSTDEEIAGSYQQVIEHAISDFYLLRHTEGGGTEIVRGAYFGRNADGQ